ncbi:type VI secretion system baseplate subunit TssF [Herbaspirillum rubrisubalbicans]|uniref:Type VI secretion system baseplate subunit TssF n=1 Tax=Herbaspirillum rubrisubalbicans TaxID=80842 RepID=A0AAD0XHI4_9BURK|nr:type VI secretion system baseplate subunit TssF [Herbaspirillum rubrisubalbicans]ALU89496.1 type VI secretion system protein ImpG [Herbaspirillum rubrisubalbicans M1]AYR24575.1 type VI secretion system baseplate subunit TssF [Herbaspirillum rubrisubalbicans]
MHSANTKLKDFYHAELTSLRQEGMAFAQQHPELAHALGLNPRQARDPQVEMLMQSFAFLTGRLQYQMEIDQAASANALLNSLYPHLAAPVPSMLVAQISVKPKGNDLSHEQVLERGRNISTPAFSAAGRRIDCRFRTAYETPLMPFEVTAIQTQSLKAYPWLCEDGNGDTKNSAVLRVSLRSKGVANLKGRGRLRFFLNPTEPGAYDLYDLLALHLDSMAITVPQTSQTRRLPVEQFRWLGEADDEAMLPCNPQTHPGYRLLQEYFSFPEKFMFFEVSQIDFGGVCDQFDLLFLLDSELQEYSSYPAQTLRLNCVPLVNLYPQRLDPLKLDHSKYEYHLLGDLENHRYCEIYAIETLESSSPRSGTRTIAPYFAIDQSDRLEQQDYFYTTRREASQGVDIAGSEIFISFLDQQFNTTQLVDEVIGGRALCTNRRLPEQLDCGAPLYLEGPGAVSAITVLSKPSPHQNPPIIGTRPWALVSQLSLNHLSLADSPLALGALKDILRLHLGPNAGHGLRQIEGLQGLHCHSIMRHRHIDGWRGFVRGHDVRLQIDQHCFEDASAVLFCAVLRHFFRSYATVNQLVEVSLEMNNLTGVQKQWQPLAGAQVVL